MIKIRNVIQCLKKMEGLSKIIVRTAFWTVFLVYLAGILCLLSPEYFGDFSTALYWAEQLGVLGRELLGATVVPVLIFEILFYGKGMKKTNT